MSRDLLKYAPPWLKSRWARVFGTGLLFVVALALVAPYFLNVDRYRAKIADMISLQTGRKVTLGKLRANFLPNLGFSVDGLEMANPPGFAQGVMVSAQEIRGSLAFWPLLLRRELRVISLELMSPRLMLLEDDFGRNNYTPPPHETTSAVPARKQPRRDSGSIALMVDNVTMRDADIFYGVVDRRGRPSATFNVVGLNVELRQLALQPLRIHDWQADARLGGTQLILAGWNAPVSFDSGSVILREGRLDSSFTLQFGKAARIEGTLNVPNVEKAVPQFDLKTAELDANALLSGATPEPSLPARGPPANSNTSPRAAGPARVPATASAPAIGVSKLVAAGHLVAEKIRDGSHSAGPLSADLRIYNDRTEVWPFTLRLAGGTVQLTARTDRRQVPQRFSANIQVRELNTEQILRDSPSLRGKFAGTAELELQLVGSIESQWAQSIAGNGQFAIRNGRIAGFNLSGAAQSFASLAGISGDTPFTRIAGDLKIGDGRVSSRQIHMDSPRGTLDLKGSSGFYGSLDYEGRMIAQLGGGSIPAPDNASRDILTGVISSAISRNFGPAQITVPFTLGGTLQHPQLRPGRAAPKFAAVRSSQQGDPSQPPKPGFTLPDIFGK